MRLLQNCKIYSFNGFTQNLAHMFHNILKDYISYKKKDASCHKEEKMEVQIEIKLYNSDTN